MAQSKPITIYTTPTCTYCNLAKQFFGLHNLTFTEYNVAVDLEKRRQMVEKSGQLGVPVIDIDGQIIIGFDRPRISSVLGVSI